MDLRGSDDEEHDSRAALSLQSRIKSALRIPGITGATRSRLEMDLSSLSQVFATPKSSSASLRPVRTATLQQQSGRKPVSTSGWAEVEEVRAALQEAESCTSQSTPAAESVPTPTACRSGTMKSSPGMREGEQLSVSHSWKEVRSISGTVKSSPSVREEPMSEERKPATAMYIPPEGPLFQAAVTAKSFVSATDQDLLSSGTAPGGELNADGLGDTVRAASDQERVRVLEAKLAQSTAERRASMLEERMAVAAAEARAKELQARAESAERLIHKREMGAEAKAKEAEERAEAAERRVQDLMNTADAKSEAERRVRELEEKMLEMTAAAEERARNLEAAQLEEQELAEQQVRELEGRLAEVAATAERRTRDLEDAQLQERARADKLQELAKQQSESLLRAEESRRGERDASVAAQSIAERAQAQANHWQLEAERSRAALGESRASCE
eukprot:Hpha_TRINITY_DN3024_c0_g2::TRINITY_DN3024_c0_g2_i1::g.138621::m.138621